MQLNNINNNTIAEIVLIDPNNNTFSYLVKDLNENILSGENCDIELIDFLRTESNFEDICLDYLLNEVLTEGFVKSDDLQNWIHTTRTVRLIVPQETIIESLKDDNDLWPIIKRLRDENKQATEKFIFETKEIAVVYVNDIDPGDAPIVAPYIAAGIIKKEDKIIT